MGSWRKFQIWRYSWILLRATENALADHIWSEGRYLPTPALTCETKIASNLIAFFKENVNTFDIIISQKAPLTITNTEEYLIKLLFFSRTRLVHKKFLWVTGVTDLLKKFPAPQEMMQTVIFLQVLLVHTANTYGNATIQSVYCNRNRRQRLKHSFAIWDLIVQEFV